MKLSISNIGWAAEQDAEVYDLMKRFSFSGLEIAPTRIFPENPYEKLDAAREWAQMLKQQHGFCIPSMQSIWFGRQERIFGTADEREILLDSLNECRSIEDFIKVREKLKAQCQQNEC